MTRTRAITDAEAAFGVVLGALREWPVGLADQGRISVPTLSVVHRGPHQHVPRCRGATVELSSHLLPIADARLVADVVAPFLREHPLDARPS
ncbi:MAG: hypothetical protein ACLGIF_09670 [Actinomycetes bacterium]